MESFYRTHAYLLDHLNTPVRRDLMDQIDWDHRMIAIKGTRGVGKTTFLLQYAKEKFGKDRSCLYINMNNFYFSNHTLVEFVSVFNDHGGKTLLIDQIFKHDNWAAELRECYERFPRMKFVFAVSSVMRLTSEKEDEYLYDIVKMYNLRGFSFREFLNMRANLRLPSYTLKDILANHEQIARSILSKVNPSNYLQEYFHHGFYPFFLEKRNFTENLLKTMNMMIEVDILIIKQIELKYLSKIKKLLYLLSVDGPKAPNVSRLAEEIDTSRATVMNYIKYLQDARMVNLVYKDSEAFPKKPARILMHNTNLMYAIYPLKFDDRDVIETFFVNNMWKDHTVSSGNSHISFLVDDNLKFKLCMDKTGKRKEQDVIYVMKNLEIGHDNLVPLWLLGFLY
jgi:predicted AAA+ superfamily ATPase